MHDTIYDFMLWIRSLNVFHLILIRSMIRFVFPFFVSEVKYRWYHGKTKNSATSFQFFFMFFFSISLLRFHVTISFEQIMNYAGCITKSQTLDFIFIFETP